MPIDIQILCRQLNAAETILFLGAGSSIPSGGMSGSDLAKIISEHFKLEYDSSLSLPEIATIIEKKIYPQSANHLH